MDADHASRLAREWLSAWNRHDVDAILAHYAEPLAFTSPLVVKRLGRADGTIRSLAELREYVRMGLQASPDLRFELLECLLGVDSLCLYYRNHRGQHVAEVLHLGPDGRIHQVHVHYS
ncbi:MAG TPA: nuclear transport factor 2 family protein [bacterium]|nr:nuclear transport factor 2 family protein [bacterium]